MSEPAITLPQGSGSPDSEAVGSVPAKRNSVTSALGSAALNPTSNWLEVVKWIFSFPAMLGMALVGRVFYEARNFFVDPDLWWHIKVGQDILRTHHFPTTDSYSWTVAGHPWIAYEWLGEIALALIHRAGGVMALSGFLIVLSTAIVLSLYGLTTIRSKNSKAAFLSTLIFTSIAFGSFSGRPQMFGYLFLVLTLIILEKFRAGVTWPLWALPLIFMAWVNTHGSFIIGIGVVVLHVLTGLFKFNKGNIEAVAWTQKQRMQLETVLLCCLIALAVTPYGTQLAMYPFDMATSQPVNVANVIEWQPMPFALVGGKIYLGIIVVFFILQLLFRFTWRLEEMVLAIGGTAMACLHVRFILLFVPFVAPLFAAMLARWVPGYKRPIDKYFVNAVLMAAAIAAMVHYRPTHKSLDDGVRKVFPVGAVNYLREHPLPGKMLNTYAAGGYLVLSGVPTFIDGRGDVFERGGVFGDYMHLMRFNPGAFSVLKNYDISVCLLERDEPLAQVLLASPQWYRVYVDETDAIFVRK